MTKLYIFLGIIIIAIIVYEKFSKKTEEKIYPFEQKPNFLTPTEKAFFEVLLQIINNRYFIFPQIHLASILQVKKGEFDRRGWKRYFNQLIQKSFDFVIFDKQTLLPLLVIELDDYTHNLPERKLRDSFVDEALKVASLNIIHIKPQNMYNINEIQMQLKTFLK